MVDLALYSINDSVTLKSISERQNISESYLEQIFSSLRKNGLIKGRKGSQGGYILANGMSEITVGEILRALEGELSVVAVDDLSSEDKLEKCIANNVWNKINKSIDEIVDAITLEELVFRYSKEKDGNYMYYI